MKTANVAAGGVPIWVFPLLVILVLLGIRRLRTREMPVAVALIAPTAFVIWSVVATVAFTRQGGIGVAVGAWLIGVVAGVLTGTLLPDPRGQRLSAARVCQPGSRVPLLLYLGVFAARFACGTWAALAPAQAITATAVGLAVSAAVTGRLVVSVARWRPAVAG